MTKATLGFIGLGNMGGPMAGRLIAAGHKLYVCDRDDAAAKRLEALGATRVASAAELADKVDTVLMSLPTPEIVQHVALSAGGLAEGRKLKVVVDLSTIGPRAAVQVAQGLRARDIEYVDSPVSGGVTGAVKGTLAVMVSCRREAYDSLEAVLQIIGKTFFVGPEAGQAQTVKLANNIMSAAAVAITSEAVVMGVKAGIDPKLMLDVINAGSGRNTASADKFPRCVLPRTFDVGFAAALAHKDVRLCVDEAEHMGVPMVVGASVREMLAITLAQCGPDADFVDVVKVCESWAGVEVRG
jgi:3-hydroxyisobutyrate dehydrogenase-like beta-hydroxyacid dehydrogenase